MSGSYPSPETIGRVELANGTTVLCYQTQGSPSVVLSGYLWAGALQEPRAKAGRAYFTAGTLMHGTETRSFGQINDALESVGAQLGIGAGTHNVSFGGKALAEDLDLLLDTLADCLRAPAFPQKEVQKVRGQILTDLERRAHDTRRMANLTFDALLYPDHPYGRSVKGYTETVSGLERQDLLAHYQAHYSPQGMVIAVVGAVSAAEVVDRVEATLGQWQAPQAAPVREIPPSVDLPELRRQLVGIEGKSQTDIVLGWPGLRRADPDFVPAYLANTILGTFGMMGRLGDQIRDEQGLAYYVYSRLEAGLGAGPWVAVAGVDPTNVERAVAGILTEVRRLRDEPVEVQELADSQSYLTGSLPLRLETNEGIAASLLEIERYGLGLDHLQRYDGLIRAVTVDGVAAVVGKYLDPEIYCLAIAGPEA
jgi:zinc protease